MKQRHRLGQQRPFVPIFKKGDKTCCANYRGISLLDISSKVFENIIIARIRPERELRSRENQAGFRPGRSCTDQIFTFRQILEQRNEFHQPTIIAFIVFKAAFDNVHRISIWKLMKADGLPDKILHLIQALLF